MVSLLYVTTVKELITIVNIVLIIVGLFEALQKFYTAYHFLCNSLCQGLASSFISLHVVGFDFYNVLLTATFSKLINSG